MRKYLNDFDRNNFEGKTYKSKHYGEFKVVKYSHSHYIDIEFIDTGFTTTVQAGDIQRGSVRDRSIKSSREELTEHGVTQELVQKYFDYDDGKLYWKITRYKGQEAGSLDLSKGTGYYRINWGGRTHYRSRLIYIYHHGAIDHCIDHIDGDTHNDKVENLADKTHSANMLNKRKFVNNTSGVTGVSKMKDGRRKCWMARFPGKKTRYFEHMDEAIEQRRIWEDECVDMTPRHGK